MTEEKFDFVIVGSGFGGSVSALRLAEKGYRVAVLETGKRWRAEDFARSNWDVRRYLWMPLLRCFGPQRISLVKNLMVLRGTGVGGGSLIYANTLMQPKPAVFDDPSWPAGTDWDDELRPHYNTARRMLGVTTNRTHYAAEEALLKLGRELGVESTFHPTEVGIYFGEAGQTKPDPYFGGEGPARTGCTLCGGCMVGCRHGAKNSLDRNYLYLAEKRGVKVFPERSADRLVPQADGSYTIETKRSTSWFGLRGGETLRADRVVVAAGVMGTLEILMKNRDRYGTLPHVSPKLGETVRTNGESLLGATAVSGSANFSEGIAIGAAIHPDEVTKIEAVKYPSGSSFMRVMAVPLTGDGNYVTRPLKMVWSGVVRLPRFVKMLFIRDWAQSSVVLLVMQSIDTRMRFRWGRSIYRGFSEGLVGEPTKGFEVPSYMPIAQKAGHTLSQIIDGEAQNVMSEVLLKSPATAHVLGGAAIAMSSDSGVVDANHEVFGHRGLYVCDGSVIPSNLAVNPSLTITALAERFASRFPSKSK